MREKQALEQTKEPPLPDSVLIPAFEKLMLDLGYDEQKRKIMSTSLNSWNKYRLLEQYQQHTVSDHCYTHIANLRTDPTETKVQQLRVSLSHRSMQWLKQFFENDGLNALLELLSDLQRRRNKPLADYRVLWEVVMCFSKVMFTPVGLPAIVNNPLALRTLALTLESEFKPEQRADPANGELIEASYKAKLAVLDLLTKLCLIPQLLPEGARYVMESLDNFKLVFREKKRFQTLIDSLKDPMSSPEYKCQVVKLFSAILVRIDHLPRKMHLRDELEKAGLDGALNDLKAMPNDALANNIALYFEELEADAEEARENPIDLSISCDPDAMFRNISAALSGTDAYPFMAEVLQQMVKLAHDPDSPQWGFLARMVPKLLNPTGEVETRKQLDDAQQKVIELEDFKSRATITAEAREGILKRLRAALGVETNEQLEKKAQELIAISKAPPPLPEKRPGATPPPPPPPLRMGMALAQPDDATSGFGAPPPSPPRHASKPSLHQARLSEILGLPPPPPSPQVGQPAAVPAPAPAPQADRG
eukprot:GAFH01001298.1.p1 GENE.GAFH01001298.1~~GAFH01001298.1.p1  ORF type:complete len:573 (-),score=194.82 GAFH01001298.1:21-1622(-)